MIIEKGGTIKLSDSNEYAIISIINYENHKYLYLVDINDNTNIKFCEEKDENSVIKMIEIDNAELIKKLLPLFVQDTKDIVLDIIENS